MCLPPETFSVIVSWLLKPCESNSTDLPLFLLWWILILTSDQCWEVWLGYKGGVVSCSLAAVPVAIRFALSAREQNGVLWVSFRMKFTKSFMPGSCIVYNWQRSKCLIGLLYEFADKVANFKKCEGSFSVKQWCIMWIFKVPPVLRSCHTFARTLVERFRYQTWLLRFCYWCRFARIEIGTCSRGQCLEWIDFTGPQNVHLAFSTKRHFRRVVWQRPLSTMRKRSVSDGKVRDTGFELEEKERHFFFASLVHQ